MQLGTEANLFSSNLKLDFKVKYLLYHPYTAHQIFLPVWIFDCFKESIIPTSVQVIPPDPICNSQERSSSQPHLFSSPRSFWQNTSSKRFFIFSLIWSKQMIKIDTRLCLEFEILHFGMWVFFFLIHPNNRKMNTNHNYSRIWMDFLNILHLPHLCSCRRAVLRLREAVTSLFLPFLSCAKAGYINEYQTGTKNLSSIYVFPIKWILFFLYFFSSSSTPP